MGMKVKEVAELIGVSIRTLHHYDQIGLLTPQETTDSGYRLYSEENLEQLQQILFFKELDFSLKEIKEIINSPSFNRREALILQKKMLIEKRNRVDKMIETIDKSIKHLMGEICMTNKERFEGMNFNHNLYEQEARKRWGDQPVDKVNIRLKSMTDGEQKIYLISGLQCSINLHSLLTNLPSPQAYKQLSKSGLIFSMKILVNILLMPFTD